MSINRMTYKDPTYLRDPLKTSFASAERFKEDKQKRDFEAYKLALDDQKTKYLIKQSEYVASNAN